MLVLQLPLGGRHRELVAHERDTVLVGMELASGPETARQGIALRVDIDHAVEEASMADAEVAGIVLEEERSLLADVVEAAYGSLVMEDTESELADVEGIAAAEDTADVAAAVLRNAVESDLHRHSNLDSTLQVLICVMRDRI